MPEIDALPDVMNHSRAIHPAVALSLISPIQLLRRKEFKGSHKLTRPELHHVCPVSSLYR
jgi:hypothetical protein